MKIDTSKVNLSEKDIEDWLYQNPKMLYAPHSVNPVKRWIGRQYSLPSGIADLVGVRENGMVVVVEIKNVAINKAAILQVCRYAYDIKKILGQRMDYPHVQDWHDPVVEMLVVGPSIDSQTFTEAYAVGVRIFQFSAEVTVALSSLAWSDMHEASRSRQHEQIAARSEWDMFGMTVTEDVDRLYGGFIEPEATSDDDSIEDDSDITFSQMDIQQ